MPDRETPLLRHSGHYINITTFGCYNIFILVIRTDTERMHFASRARILVQHRLLATTSRTNRGDAAAEPPATRRTSPSSRDCSAGTGTKQSKRQGPAGRKVTRPGRSSSPSEGRTWRRMSEQPIINRYGGGTFRPRDPIPWWVLILTGMALIFFPRVLKSSE